MGSHFAVLSKNTNELKTRLSGRFGREVSRLGSPIEARILGHEETEPGPGTWLVVAIAGWLQRDQQAAIVYVNGTRRDTSLKATMSDYDFRSLSPHDFELLCRDILQKPLGVQLESFTAVRDCGIDFRYRWGDANLIVQCKHYAASGYKHCPACSQARSARSSMSSSRPRPVPKLGPFETDHNSAA